MTHKFLQTSEIYGKTLVELGDFNENIFVVEADLMKASGSIPFKEKYPQRHINVGVAEQNLVGVAAGLASMGKIPFACTMSNFISQRASDQVTISVAFNKFNVKLIGCFAGLSQEKNGGTHISIMDIAVMRCLPNMQVVVPADRKELIKVLKEVAKFEGPVYVRMSRNLPDSLFDDTYDYNLFKGYVIGDGCDLTIVSTGITTSIAIDALSALLSENIRARVLHLPNIKPIDKDLIIKCAEETKAMITLEDHSIFGGLGSLVSEILSEYYPTPIYRIGLKDVFGITASLDFQLSYFGLSVENIIFQSKNILSKKLKSTK